MQADMLTHVEPESYDVVLDVFTCGAAATSTVLRYDNHAQRLIVRGTRPETSAGLGNSDTGASDYW